VRLYSRGTLRKKEEKKENDGEQPAFGKHPENGVPLDDSDQAKRQLAATSA